MNKIKILALSSDNDGVGYYRILNPHSYMNYDDIDIDIRLLTDGSLMLSNDSFTGQFDIIVYNKNIP